ncbi:MAG: hypothetical protein G01um101466_150 [Parcubacteria group bacterium Gr01-1014_66]|nr:MAG: hypothetical protein G01um101466_150 [Parcubacteria group bacterium Gr01-1014_66]
MGHTANYKIIIITIMPQDDIGRQNIFKFLDNTNDVVIVVDSSSDLKLHEQLQTHDAKVFPQRISGLAPAKREGFNYGQRHVYTVCRHFLPNVIYIWMESIYEDISNHIPHITAPLISYEADIVIVGRTAQSSALLSKTQQAIEYLGNSAYETTGMQGGPMTGVIAFTDAMMHYFASCYPETYGEDMPEHFGYIEHLAPIVASVHGAQVVGVDIDLQHTQAKSEETFEDIFAQIKKLSACVKSYKVIAEKLNLSREPKFKEPELLEQS